MINRAPVLTLWASVVAGRLGFDHDESLSLGRAVAGLNAQSKGRRLGIFKPSAETLSRKRDEPGEKSFSVELLHRAVPCELTEHGIRATTKGVPIGADSVERYLAAKFGDTLEPVREAMAAVAMSYTPDELAQIGFKLYEKFRPEVPEGAEGWGAGGMLSVAKIRSLVRKS
jgi:hypothetical protein